MLHLTAAPAFWGLLGAIIYAAPKLTSCVYAGEGRRHVGRCIVEAITALVIGTVAAAAFVPWVASYLHATASRDTMALATVVGMLANTTAPGIIKFMGETVLNRIRGGH